MAVDGKPLERIRLAAPCPDGPGDIAGEVVARFQRKGVRRTAYTGTTLCEQPGRRPLPSHARVPRGVLA
jgi:hypothetical protein